MQEAFCTLIGVSAREALQAKLEHDPEKLKWSNWADVDKLIEQVAADDVWKAQRLFDKLHQLFKEIDAF